MDGAFDIEALRAGFAAAAVRAVASLADGQTLTPECIRIVVRLAPASPERSLWRLGRPGEGTEALELTWRPGEPAHG
jgi:hypothetical protein